MDFHLFSSHGSGLSKNKVSDLADLLDRLEVTDKNIIIFAHLQNRVGKGDIHGHVKTLGNGYNKHDQGNNEAVDNTIDEFTTFICRSDSSLVNDGDDDGSGKNNDGA